MTDINKQLMLIAGESATGKSASLRNLHNPEKWIFVGTEAGKKLPFPSKFQEFQLDDPLQIFEVFDHFTADPSVEGIIIDSLTFLMDMYESQYVLTSNNGMRAWNDFQQFFKTLMQDKVIKFPKPVIFLAHQKSELNTETGVYESKVPIKGALQSNGVEAYFSLVIKSKAIPIKDLKLESKLLHITPEEEEDGFKYVFQTRKTKTSTGDRIRAPMGLFARNDLYIDNDVQVVLDRLNEYYK